jgi:hypothetical protein
MKILTFIIAFSLAAAPAFGEASDSSTGFPTKPSVWNGQELTFANGAKIKVSGSTLTTTADGVSSTTERGGKTPPPPRSMASCSYMRKWLDSHPVNNTWRANSLTYADRCF